MKLGLYKVNNSLGYERHTFDNIYDDPRKIEEMLQPLLDKDEAAIIGLEDVESIDWFAEEYNDELYDGGWWAVTIRDYDEPKRTVWVVTYVGLSDSEYAANGYCKCHVCGTLEAAKEKMRQLRDEEIENCKAEGRDYEILEDETTELRMSWCSHGEQVRLEIHEEEVK